MNPTLTSLQNAVLQRVQDGIPPVSRPYLAIANELGISEDEVVNQIRTLRETGVIKRFGLVVKHHEVGFRHNAMVVWDIADHEVQKVAELFIKHSFVTLCYRRPRRPPHWRYNLFCMIHGNNRETVLEQIDRLKASLTALGVQFANDVLFSKRRFKQVGANYFLKLEDIDRHLINDFQNGLPLSETPFAEFAEKFRISEHEVVFRIERLMRDGYLTRFGPMYNIDKGGGQFVLCALEVPDERYERVTEIVNSFSEVAHNYRREHFLNMWFVLGVEDKEKVDSVLQQIERATELKVYAFPKLREFFVDLRFTV